MIVRMTLIAAVALLGGCRQPADKGAQDIAVANAKARAEPDYLQQIDKLNIAQQHLVLFRAVRDAGQDCQDLTKSERLEDQDGRHLWRVTCRGGGQFAVMIGADGVANVTGPTAPRS